MEGCSGGMGRWKGVAVGRGGGRTGVAAGWGSGRV